MPNTNKYIKIGVTSMFLAGGLTLTSMVLPSEKGYNFLNPNNPRMESREFDSIKYNVAKLERSRQELEDVLDEGNPATLNLDEVINTYQAKIESPEYQNRHRSQRQGIRLYMAAIILWTIGISATFVDHVIRKECCVEDA